ncbi:hypothetical protein Tco_0408838 [Tanacetum coccineum]
MGKVLQERGSGSLPSSTETNPRDHVNSVLTTVETDTTPIRRIGSTRYAKGSYGLKDLDAYSIGTTLRIDTLPRKEKDPGSFTLLCYIDNVYFEKALADLGASTMKHHKGIAENVPVGIGKFVFPIDFIILDMPSMYGYITKRTKMKQNRQNRAWEWEECKKSKPKAFTFLEGQPGSKKMDMNQGLRLDVEDTPQGPRSFTPSL